MRLGSRSVAGKCLLASAFLLAVLAFTNSQAQAQIFKAVYSFTGGADGGNPFNGLTIDSAGNFYGSAYDGGSYGAGAVFKVTPTGQEKAVYSFTGGTDGANPLARLIMDSAGNFYGTTYGGGAYGTGTVFELTKSGKEKVLYSFAGGSDGANPEASLATDAAGNFYGTTYAGGAYGAGTVFELTKGGTETVLHSFGSGTDGAYPVAEVTVGPNGQLFGTTSEGGAYGWGTVFQMMTKSGAVWKETVVHDFAFGSDGATPDAGLVLGRGGVLYGATYSGGDGAGGGGTIFEVAPSGGSWTFTAIYGLSGWSNSGTLRDVLLDPAGNIYATTHCDGSDGLGTVYKLTRSSGGTWTYTELYDFTGGSDGYYSFSNLVVDKYGNLYGTVAYGGIGGAGVVFKVAP